MVQPAAPGTIVPVVIYLDHAATTPMRPQVWEAMAPYASDVFGNSSGVHQVSRRAKNALEEARERIAVLIGAQPGEIVFTSGGTESDNLALKGPVLAHPTRRGLITVATEHEAVLESADFLKRTGHPVTIVAVDREGRVAAEDIAESVGPETAVVSVMLVNNETGTVQDVAGIVRAVKEADPGVLVHTDAVQAGACEPVDVHELGVDLLTLTGHKLGGPKGTGILFVREGTPLEPVLHGGGQELGRRSGTHDVAGAVGLATALELAVADREEFRRRVGAIRDQFASEILVGVDGAAPNTPPQGMSPHHFNVRLPGVRNETLLMRLDQRGIAASAGSACQSGAATVSHVLEAMGLTPDQARESVRFTFGWTSNYEEAMEAAEVVVGLARELS